MMVPLMLVKSTNVSLIVKMLGEMNIVLNMVMPTAHVHSAHHNVKELGTVMTSLKLSMKLWMSMTPIMMVKSISVITSKMNI